MLITKQLSPSAAGAAAAGAGGPAGRAVYAVQSSEDEDSEDEETPAERLVKRFWRVLQVLLRTQAVQMLRKAVNPPVTAVFAGELLLLLLLPVLLSFGIFFARFWVILRCRIRCGNFRGCLHAHAAWQLQQRARHRLPHVLAARLLPDVLPTINSAFTECDLTCVCVF